MAAINLYPSDVEVVTQSATINQNQRINLIGKGRCTLRPTTAVVWYYNFDPHAADDAAMASATGGAIESNDVSFTFDFDGQVALNVWCATATTPILEVVVTPL